MKAYNAWLSAKEGELIHRVSRPQILFVKNQRFLTPMEVFGIDFSADDWEVVKEKHSLTLIDTTFSGGPDHCSLADIFRGHKLERPNRFTKITFEWEG